jgi:hypothetical protein
LKVKPDLIGRDEEDSGKRKILIPFVEEIVVEVDMERREMQITPPKGLLELNSRSAGSSKERRHMVWSACMPFLSFSIFSYTESS